MTWLIVYLVGVGVVSAWQLFRFGDGWDALVCGLAWPALLPFLLLRASVSAPANPSAGERRVLVVTSRWSDRLFGSSRHEGPNP